MLARILGFLGLRSEEFEREVEQAFYDLPDPRQRAQMSPERLAILLSQQQPDTPAYILIEHELNLRITSVQSKATIRSGWLGLGGTLLGTILGFVLGTLSPKAEQSLREQVLRCECVNQVQQPPSESKPLIRSSTVPPTISANGKPTRTKVQNEKDDGNIKR